MGALAQESINVVLSVLVREIRALEKNIKELDKAIEQVIVVIPEYQCLTSIPGVGKVYAAGLIAEIGQIERFEDQTKFHEDDELKKLNTLVTIENPFRVKQFSRMFDENKTDRNDALRIADFLRIQRFTFYQSKYKEVPKHQHKRALVLTARKFTRLVDTLLRKHQLYTPPRSVIEK
ncbi:hypothetical protein EfmJHP35_05050 [Enterococcus faecium]|nr:hypothetical protein EfmJHP35_05050 [Enterococcus faecium]